MNWVNVKDKEYKPMVCPVCHDTYFSPLTESDFEYGRDLQCQQCGWIYDLAQVEDKDLVDAENGISLREYRKRYQELIRQNPNYNYQESQYKKKTFLCPVCHKHRFPDRGTFEICPECGWEEDGIMDLYPDKYEGCANDLCFNDFKARYERLLKENPNYRYKKDGIPD